MHNESNDGATICGLLYAALLSNIPSEWMSYVDKLFWGAVLALVTGFTYKAGGWAWDKMIRRMKGL